MAGPQSKLVRTLTVLMNLMMLRIRYDFLPYLGSGVT